MLNLPVWLKSCSQLGVITQLVCTDENFWEYQNCRSRWQLCVPVSARGGCAALERLIKFPIVLKSNLLTAKGWPKDWVLFSLLLQRSDLQFVHCKGLEKKIVARLIYSFYSFTYLFSSLEELVLRSTYVWQ